MSAAIPQSCPGTKSRGVSAQLQPCPPFVPYQRKRGQQETDLTSEVATVSPKGCRGPWTGSRGLQRTSLPCPGPHGREAGRRASVQASSMGLARQGGPWGYSYQPETRLQEGRKGNSGRGRDKEGSRAQHNGLPQGWEAPSQILPQHCLPSTHTAHVNIY